MANGNPFPPPRYPNVWGALKAPNGGGRWLMVALILGLIFVLLHALR